MAHKQFLCHPVQRSSRPGTRTKMFVFLEFPHTAHKHLTPGHPGRQTPLIQAISGPNCLCLCAVSFHERPDTAIMTRIHREKLGQAKMFSGPALGGHASQGTSFHPKAKLPFMILSLPEQPAEKWVFLQKHASPPTEK